MKICKQCGEIKQESEYRKYYGGRKGSYRTCKTCEKINARAKYLKSKERSDAESNELDKIYKLYDAQRAAGLQPPREGANRATPLAESLDDMINKYTKHVGTTAADKSKLAEIEKWLTVELTAEPDYYIDEVYEQLLEKYRPVVRVDTTNMQPVYDDTYKSALEKVLDRFYDYETKYWED